MSDTDPGTWDTLKIDLEQSDEFQQVPVILENLGIAMPTGMTSTDLVAAAAAHYRLILAVSRAESAIDIVQSEDPNQTSATGLTAVELYKRGQKQADLAHGIMRVTGVSRELVNELPWQISFHTTTQIETLETTLRSNGLVD